MGEFLVYSFLHDHFGLSDATIADLVAPLPDDLRDLARLWINLYLCWLFRMQVRAKYGDPFFDVAFAAARARLARGENLDPGTAGFADDLAWWFAQLDKAASSLGQTFQGKTIPMEVFAGWAFLTATPESPFFQTTEMPSGLDLDVAHILESAKASARD